MISPWESTTAFRTWLSWQLYRFWKRCNRKDCAHYWTRPSCMSFAGWHQLLHERS